MLDMFNTPSGLRNYVSEYFPNSPTAGTAWYQWIKPKGVAYVSMLCIGGGGGGGGGAGAAGGAAKGGGGGGGSSGISRALFLASMLPDSLFVSVGFSGVGGAGGSSGNGTAGTAGIISHICVIANVNIVAQNIFLASGAIAAGGGGAGTTAAAGGTGAAGTTAVITTCVLSQSALSTQFVAGVVGIIGGAQTGAVGGAGVNNPTACQILSGCGGAGSTSADFAGGGYAALSNTYWVGSAGGIAGNGAGNPGFRPLPNLLAYYGGTGGGSSNSTTGGAGGYGVLPGTGGGGGGGGTTTGGRGGDGGPGYVNITSW